MMGSLDDKRGRIMDNLIDEMRHKYRAVFDNQMGREVLNHMLFELHFFNDELQHPYEIALHNYAKRLLWYIGIWDTEYVANPNMINKLMELPLIPEGKKDAEGNPGS